MLDNGYNDFVLFDSAVFDGGYENDAVPCQ
jgi:hypothetical protein